MNEITLDADRRLRGPYTLAAGLLDLLVPEALERWPDLVHAHDVEIRAAAPQLGVPALRRTLAAELPPGERILLPGPSHTLRLANGLAEFVRDHLGRSGPLAVIARNLGEADQSDLQLVEVLRRRVAPELLTITEGPGGPHEGTVPLDLDRYRNEGFHHAMVEAGTASLQVTEHDADPEGWWTLVHRTANALAALEREEEARRLYDRARQLSVDPVNRATAAYATAMLLVRHHDPARRDLEEAMSWVNEAITITSLLPDRRTRAFHLGFDLNGKALVLVRRGHREQALELVQQAIELAERDLGSGEHPIHRLILKANRAQLLGTDPQALRDLDEVIAADPGYPDYYLDRGNLLHRLGRPEEAVADYESAMRAGPPFPEPYFNRAELRFAIGHYEEALADLDYALELDPGFVHARVNRAGLLVMLGEYGKARADAEQGPGNPYLLSVLGQVETAEGRHTQARKAFDSALELDPRLAAAWAGRGVLAFEAGEVRAAIDDLSRAIELGESAELRFNRAMALRAAGRTEEARADLLRAAELDPGDEDIKRSLEER